MDLHSPLLDRFSVNLLVVGPNDLVLPLVVEDAAHDRLAALQRFGIARTKHVAYFEIVARMTVAHLLYGPRGEQGVVTLVAQCGQIAQKLGEGHPRRGEIVQYEIVLGTDVGELLLPG